MGAEMRAMLTGGGVVLVVVGGLFGLWSMGQAPAPPAVTVARAEETAVRKELLATMHEFISHYKRASLAIKAGNSDVALAHLGMVAEFATDLDASDRLGHRIPEDQIKSLRTQVASATEAVKTKAPNAVQAVLDLRNHCVACHATQKGPTPEVLFGP